MNGWAAILRDVDYPTAVEVVDALITASKPGDDPPNPGFIRSQVRDITERKKRIAEDRDPPINSKEWPWTLSRSEVRQRYASTEAGGFYPPGTIAFAADGCPVIFGYEKLGYKLRKNGWMITQEEMNSRKLRNPARVYEITGLPNPVGNIDPTKDPRMKEIFETLDLRMDHYDPVPIYIAEMKKLGKKPDEGMIKSLKGMWDVFCKRHGINQREPGEEG